MKLHLQGSAILLIAFLFLAGCAPAAAQLTTGNGTGGSPDTALNSTAPPAGNLTVPLAGNVSPGNGTPGTTAKPVPTTIHPRPTETIHPVPLPKILSLDYTKPSACTVTEGGEDDSGRRAGRGILPGGDGLNITGDNPVSSSSVFLTGGSGGSYGGIGNEETKDGRVLDCLMRNYMDEILDEPSFVDFYAGPDRDLHYPFTATLLGVDPGQYKFITRVVEEDRGFLDTCYDTNPIPYWVWIEVDAEFQTSIAKPRDFDTTLYVNSHGAEIPVMSTINTYYLDHMYNYTVYIPVKCEQVQEIDSVKLNFKQVE